MERDIDLPARARAAVLDRIPLSREGLEAALGASGFVLAKPGDLGDGATPKVVVVALRKPDDWRILESYGESPAPVVAMIGSDPSRDQLCWLSRRALALGACSVVPADSPTQVILAAVHAALAGLSVLPAVVVKPLAAGLPALPDGLTPQELGWLRLLVTSETVADLAHQVGWSARTMHRRLASLYRRLGVKGRQEAVLWLERAGLGADPPWEEPG